MADRSEYQRLYYLNRFKLQKIRCPWCGQLIKGQPEQYDGKNYHPECAWQKHKALEMDRAIKDDGH